MLTLLNTTLASPPMNLTIEKYTVSSTAHNMTLPAAWSHCHASRLTFEHLLLLLCSLTQVIR